MAKPAIGFFGLSPMGSAMCRRLLDRECPPTVIARRLRDNVEKAVARRAVAAETSKPPAERTVPVMVGAFTERLKKV